MVDGVAFSLKLTFCSIDTQYIRTKGKARFPVSEVAINIKLIAPRCLVWGIL
jgi:hypothetical protein